MSHAIHTEALTKFYGKKRGVIELNLDVQTGEVFGFLGPNGAGKTTTIRLLLDFIKPTQGRAEVLGQDVHLGSREIHRRIGYLPGELALYENLSGREMLEYFAHLRGGVDWGYAVALAKRLELELGGTIRTLSKGNKQKVGLVQALMHRPELLILDEPTSGLDPLVQQEFYKMIEEAKAEGRTVFLSSHVMAEVEHICDHVGIIRAGKLVVVDEVRDLKSKSLRFLTLEFSKAVPQEVFAGLPGVRDLSIAENVLRCTVEGSVDQLIKKAAQFEMHSITSHEPDLEEIFLTYYREGNDHVD